MKEMFSRWLSPRVVMTALAVLIIVMIAVPGANAAGNRDYCITPTGRWCNGMGCCNDEFHLRVQNHCDERLTYEYCLKKRNGKWDCGQSSLRPREGSSMGSYACDATGEYKVIACSRGSHCNLKP